MMVSWTMAIWEDEDDKLYAKEIDTYGYGSSHVEPYVSFSQIQLLSDTPEKVT